MRPPPIQPGGGPGAVSDPPAASRIALWLPHYDVRSFHALDADAPAAEVDARLPTVDLGRSRTVRALLRLRCMPTDAVSLDGALRMGFVPLEHRAGIERLYGLVGRFWTARGGIVRVAPEAFAGFDRPGYAKAVLSFLCEDIGDGRTRVSTETRVLCTDPAARRRFLRYWRLIGPFSGYIRRRGLEQVARAVAVR